MIGSLNRRVSLERPDGTADGGGGESTLWTVVDVVWAQIKPDAARQAETADALTTTTRFDVRLRHRTDVRPGWRLNWDGTPLRVLAATDPVGDKTWLDLICERELA